MLHQLGESVLYFDTDSTIYKSSTGEDLVPTGDFLGELTGELNGHHIVEFLSPGPNNYSYKFENGQCFCKIKGFIMDHRAQQLLNFEKMKEEVSLWYQNEHSTNTVVSYPKRIKRNPLEQTIYNRDESKKYDVVYTKRALSQNFDTKPYCY